jgi:diacylglycerol kinase (ATP)
VPGHIALIVNPRAGLNRAGRELPTLMTALDATSADYEVHATMHPGHATELAAIAAAAGASTVAAIGGDGTVNEVVNGLMQTDQEVRPNLGVVAAGSGADFARSFDLPEHTNTELRGVIGETRRIDVGHMQFGDRSSHHFVNLANIGLAAATVERAERLPRRLGKARYIVAFWPVLARYSKCEISVTVDGRHYSENAHNLLLANGRFAGGGMNFSPHSDTSDGLFDAQMNIGPKRQAVSLIPKIYRGKHLPDARILQVSGSRFEIDAERPLIVEADGELLGETPVTITVIAGALEMVV